MLQGLAEGPSGRSGKKRVLLARHLPCGNCLAIVYRTKVKENCRMTLGTDDHNCTFDGPASGPGRGPALQHPRAEASSAEPELPQIRGGRTMRTGSIGEGSPDEFQIQTIACSWSGRRVRDGVPSRQRGTPGRRRRRHRRARRGRRMAGAPRRAGRRAHARGRIVETAGRRPAGLRRPGIADGRPAKVVATAGHHRTPS